MRNLFVERLVKKMQIDSCKEEYNRACKEFCELEDKINYIKKEIEEKEKEIQKFENALFYFESELKKMTGVKDE
jgi:chromosome segregation ATPase